MPGIDDLLNQLPLDELAGKFGVSPDQVANAAQSGLGALFGGLEANAQDPAGAQSLANALEQHATDSIPSLDQVDVADGEKIVNNIFGDNKDQVINTLGGTGAAAPSMFSKLLPMLAPMVMAYLAKQFTAGRLVGDAEAPAAAPDQGGFGGLTDLLGGILGGGGGGGAAGGGLGGLTDLLGGLLGGGRR